jgi:sarcosine oxidase subunit beta
MSSDVVVIGAGIMGLSAAHHLEQRGVSVHVLERDGVAQATTSCGAGFVAYWAGGLITPWGTDELACEQYGIDFYTELHARRPAFPFRRAGSLYLAMTERGWEQRVKAIADFKLLGSRQLLDSSQAAEIGGIVRREGVIAGVYDPEPVQIVAREAALALAAELRESGVVIDERRPATQLLVEAGRVNGVQTASGRLAASVVVVAAGMWSNMLLRPLGRWLPYAPMGAVRITTEPLGVPPNVPMLQVPEVGAWVREERGGLLWGAGYRGDHRDAFLDGDPPERIEQLPMDGLWETERKGRELAGAIPLLARYRKFTYHQGAPCHTPDLLPLVGPVPGIDGLYVLGGDNEAGVTHGPGLGQALASEIAGPDRPASLERYRLDRFDERYGSTRDVGAHVDRLLTEISWTGVP